VKRLALLLSILMVLRPAMAAQGSCDLPEELLAEPPGLPRVAGAIAAGGPLVIAAIGGSSTAGLAAGSPERAYPVRLATALQSRHPGLTVVVHNAARPRETTHTMAGRLAADVLVHKPHLVVWEVGTMDAVRRIDVAEFSHALQAGASDIRRTGADLVFVDMQFGRGPSAVIDYERYLRRLSLVADAKAIPVLRRYDMMRYWSEQGRFDFSDKAQATHGVATELYDCIGQALANLIDRATK